MSEEALRIVREFDLAPHPEGGYYREVFRSPHRVTDDRGCERSALTIIYFLLPADDVSAWHRLRSDETWHFARGDALEIVMIDAAGVPQTFVLGPGGPYVAVIAAGRPFAAAVRAGGSFALVTCAVAPGFEFEDFEMLDADQLRGAYPEVSETISGFVKRAENRRRT